MRRRYPKSEKIKFLVCEQVRSEVNKKLSIIGLYPGDHIVFYPKVRGDFPYRLAALTFVFIFLDGSGKFDSKFEIVGPSGESKKQIVLDPIEITEGGSAGAVVALGPLEFGAEGEYVAVLRIGDKRYEFPFIVSSSDGPVPQ